MITSASNSKIQYVRRLQRERRFRRREQRFVVEGTRWMQELAADHIEPTQLFATADWLEHSSNQTLIAQFSLRPLEVTSQLMKQMADTETPAGVLAVLPIPKHTWPPETTCVLVLDAVRDPGNLGALLRSAVAAGVDGVVLAPDCVDVLNPKVVRSTMGSLLRLPIQQASWAEIDVLTAGMQVCVAAAEGATAYTAVDWLRPSVLIIGGEAHGASEAARSLADHAIVIPMMRHTESLNAAVAGSIILFEAVRQRSVGHDG